MERPLEHALRERLAEYLTGATTIDAFKTWLTASTWCLPRFQPPPAAQVVNEIKLALAEHSSGFRSDDELREGLVDVLNRLNVEALGRSAQNELHCTGSASEIVTTRPWIGLGSVFGEARVVVSSS